LTPLARALSAVGDDGALLQNERVGGGCISEAKHLRTETRDYFLKTHPTHFFEAEAHGLRLLREADALGIPEVLAVGEDFILMEWIPSSGPPHPEELGRGLAQIHRQGGARFGLETDNFIGATPQENEPTDDWVAFFSERRLAAQARFARQNGRWSSRRERLMERLRSRLGDLLPAKPFASLLHGDLWGGNVMGGPNGAPVLIDPAVYYGDRETDIAFSRLFGGFSERFYAATREAWPLEPGWEERFELYNLYHLLNHLNLFGEGYGGGVDRLLERFGS
jgi:fructosamine-3-kinase